MNVAPPQRSLPPGKPEQLTQTRKGWQWLTKAGIEACFAAGIHNEKDRRESRERMRRIRLEEAIRQYL